MARAGLTDLISEFRLSVNEAGTAVFTDDNIQTLLDQSSKDYYDYPIYPKSQYENGQTVYRKYNLVPFLEGTASGTASVRLTNSGGTVVTDYTESPINGTFNFNSDTAGSAFYYTGKSFDLNRAIANGWKRKASYYATSFDFQVEGRSFKKSQVIQQCLTMAKYYESLAGMTQVGIERGDYLC